MMGNVVARRDAKDYVFPRKARDENKIDAAIGVIAVRGLRLLARPARAYTKREGY
jgi:hypothetical protein